MTKPIIKSVIVIGDKEVKKMKRIFLAFAVLLLFVACAKPYDDDFEVVGEFEEPDLDSDMEDLDALSQDVSTEDTDKVVEDASDVSDSKASEVKSEPAKTETAKESTVSTSSASSAKTLTVKEGDLVKLNVKAADKDGDKLTYRFSSPLDDKGEWQTKAGDAGSYPVTIQVSDGKNTASQKVTVVVLEVNNAPQLSKLSDITVTEGDTVTLSPKAADKDGDKVTFEFKGWMTSSTKKTTSADVGTHKVTVFAKDSKGAEDSQTISVTVVKIEYAPEILDITLG